MTHLFFHFSKSSKPHFAAGKSGFYDSRNLYRQVRGNPNWISWRNLRTRRRDLGGRNGCVEKSCKSIKLDLRLICPDGCVELRSIDKSNWRLAHKRSQEKVIKQLFCWPSLPSNHWESRDLYQMFALRTCRANGNEEVICYLWYSGQWWWWLTSEWAYWEVLLSWSDRPCCRLKIDPWLTRRTSSTPFHASLHCAPFCVNVASYKLQVTR